MVENAPLRCDFCGRPATRVRRVALDRGYDRLGQRHAVRYACPECSRRKEEERQAVSGGAPGRGTAVDGSGKPL